MKESSVRFVFILTCVLNLYKSRQKGLKFLLVFLLHLMNTEAPILTAAIVDDDENIRNLIRIYVERYFSESIRLLGTADRVESAILLLETMRPDIIFLDIDITDGTGFEVLDAVSPLHREQIHVVFITSFREHAQLAIRYDAIDYLSKPIIAVEFKNAVERAIKKSFRTRLISEKLEQWDELTELQKNKRLINVQTGFIEVRTNDNGSIKTTVLNISEILYVKAARNYCAIIMLDGTEYMPSLPMKHYEDALMAEGCVRISRSMIVNPAHVHFRVDAKERWFARFPSGEEVSVSLMFTSLITANVP